MISAESDDAPKEFDFDVAIVAVGYERRCRYATSKNDIKARISLGLEFGFLTSDSYPENRRFFHERGFEFIAGMSDDTSTQISQAILSLDKQNASTTVFVDISSMSREMIARVLVGLRDAALKRSLRISAAYAPSKFSGPYSSAPIRQEGPVTPMLAGWSSRPDNPLGVIFGLGCEPNLALGALQLLEPKKAWVFEPKGTDEDYDAAMRLANQDIGDIFDVTSFAYDITRPMLFRGRFESVLNSVEADFRLIVVPFGPKIFAWTTTFTVLLGKRTTVGVWTFSSKEQGIPVDRDADGLIVWHQTFVEPLLA